MMKRHPSKDSTEQDPEAGDVLLFVSLVLFFPSHSMDIEERTGKSIYLKKNIRGYFLDEVVLKEPNFDALLEEHELPFL
jgi:hypothetical protein